MLIPWRVYRIDFDIQTQHLNRCQFAQTMLKPSGQILEHDHRFALCLFPPEVWVI